MKVFNIVALAAAMLCSGAANAGIISDYKKTDAVAAGWSIVYQGAYGSNFSYSSVLSSIAAGRMVALASSSSNAAMTFDLFAATSLNTLKTVTATNTTILADGTYWYRNSSSVGFAPSSQISQNSADTVNRFAGASAAANLDGDQRLSWHGGLTSVNGGWRSGLTTSLNSDMTWQRYVLVRKDAPVVAVPEPASFALLGLGLAGLAAARRKAVKKV